MKIEVARVDHPDSLVFTIIVTEPHIVPFTPQEHLTLTSMDAFIKNMENTLHPHSKLYRDILEANHGVKEKILMRVLKSLKESIKEDLQPKFDPICEEIFNWLYDRQDGQLRSWLSQFQPERTKYYFSNDAKMKYKNALSDTNYDEDEDDETDY